MPDFSADTYPTPRLASAPKVLVGTRVTAEEGGNRNGGLASAHAPCLSRGSEPPSYQLRMQEAEASEPIRREGLTTATPRTSSQASDRRLSAREPREGKREVAARAAALCPRPPPEAANRRRGAGRAHAP